MQHSHNNRQNRHLFSKVGRTTQFLYMMWEEVTLHNVVELGDYSRSRRDFLINRSSPWRRCAVHNIAMSLSLLFFYRRTWKHVIIYHLGSSVHDCFFPVVHQ